MDRKLHFHAPIRAFVFRGFLYTGQRSTLKAAKEVEMFSHKNDITPLKIKTRQSSDSGRYFFCAKNLRLYIMLLNGELTIFRYRS